MTHGIGHWAQDTGQQPGTPTRPQPVEGVIRVRADPGKRPMKIRVTPERMLKGRRVPEGGTALEGGEPVPTACGHGLDQGLDMLRTDEQVSVGARLAIAAERRVDGNPLDVQDVQTCLVGHDLQGGVRQCDAHADR
ncbi:MAG TPA: hypothetical protein VFY88_09390 [Intrasporangium sp.]|nr:hypothetical protein [Intrasporangium sp.]